MEKVKRAMGHKIYFKGYPIKIDSIYCYYKQKHISQNTYSYSLSFSWKVIKRPIQGSSHTIPYLCTGFNETIYR
jgi:hypothetical protein